MANVGKTENKGFEFTLNGTILDNHNGWTWEASLNLSANRNKLTELASGSKDDKANNWFVGHPIDCIYDYEKVGLWNSDDPDFQYLDILEPKTVRLSAWNLNSKEVSALAWPIKALT